MNHALEFGAPVIAGAETGIDEFLDNLAAMGFGIGAATAKLIWKRQFAGSLFARGHPRIDRRSFMGSFLWLIVVGRTGLQHVCHHSAKIGLDNFKLCLGDDGLRREITSDLP
jgi:hypothetical protein